ncbi:urea ABC transporter permease subunit UrtB [Mongoliimonas terrestris]|uniref:urea ABC transporter permease subunit UrtB n=1 Tax=Mongoliimonas terrestris TaxID=1709001 RepID=UPI0009497D3A|nr:urea ABC transporter permease subunit UrtB [Mongoliimonas terrestris]
MLRIAAVLIGLIFATAAGAAPLERDPTLRGLCGNAAASGEAADRLLSATPTLSPDDLAFADAAIGGLLSKKLVCPAAPTDPVALKADTGAVDLATGAPLAALPKGKAPVVSLKNRAKFERLAAALALLAAPNAAARAAALEVLAKSAADVPADLFAAAAGREPDPALAARISSVADLASLYGTDIDKRVAAVARLAEGENRRVLTEIEALRADPAYASEPAFAAAVDAAAAKVSGAIAIGNAAATLYNGLSFASILFMASIGLAIIFGLMGVINLAQGEFIMIGAYVTYVVQEGLRALLPGLLDWYLVIAIPFAFLVTALIGIALEASLIRHLYRRPLMSLLATWAVSLFLINLVRVGFGTQNLQMETPFYITGGIAIVGDFIMTWNRLFAIGFAALTLAGTWFLIRRSGIGLDIRAVTQNRDMAGCIGIPTRRVDMLAFGFGSGLAGLAGLALSPIYNVNPQMGTNFIIDSFMVVVLGGVGSIAGTVIAALGIGQINVLIEPIWGAVAAKVIVLALIIAFLQWRPEGFFTVAGRRK